MEMPSGVKMGIPSVPRIKMVSEVSRDLRGRKRFF